VHLPIPIISGQVGFTVGRIEGDAELTPPASPERERWRAGLTCRARQSGVSQEPDGF